MCALLDESASITRQLPQFPLFSAGNEARFEQPVAEQVGNPLRILDIGLAPRHRLDVSRVDD